MDTKYLSRSLFIKFLLFYLLLCIVFFQTAGRQFDYKSCSLVTERTDDSVGEIVDGKTILQHFHYEGDYIHAVQVMAGTYMRQNDGRLNIALLDENGKGIWQAEKELQEIEDNAVLEFFPDCMLEQESDAYGLKIWSEGCSEGNAVTLYCGGFSDQAAGSLAVLDGGFTASEYQNGKGLFFCILGEQKYPWHGHYWHAAAAAGVLLSLFYALQHRKERQNRPCILHSACSTLDTYRFLVKHVMAN